MPLYDYLCPRCKQKDSDIVVSFEKSDGRICSSCGSTMDRLISFGVSARVFPSEGIFLEHVSAHGKRFYSKQEMIAYEKKHDITIGMLH